MSNSISQLYLLRLKTITKSSISFHNKVPKEVFYQDIFILIPMDL